MSDSITIDDKLRFIHQFIGKKALELIAHADVSHVEAIDGEATCEHNFDKRGRVKQFKLKITVNLHDKDAT